MGRSRLLLTTAIFFLATAQFASAQAKSKASDTAKPAPKLKVGEVAPDFTLKTMTSEGLKDVSLHDYKGKKSVVLAFYVFAFTGGWTEEMKNFQKNLKSLEASDTQVLGVSMDSPFANKAFADSIGVTFPLLSDWGGKTSKDYGVVQRIGKLGYEASRRVTYLIDKSGKIAEVQIDDAAIDPAKIVQACERKKHGG